MTDDETLDLIASLESEMRDASRKLEFERAAQLRDMVVELKGRLPVGSLSKSAAKKSVKKSTKKKG